MRSPRTSEARANIAAGQRRYWMSPEGRRRRVAMREDQRLMRIEQRKMKADRAQRSET